MQDTIETGEKMMGIRIGEETGSKAKDFPARAG
jgi:hypothetical protein